MNTDDDFLATIPDPVERVKMKNKNIFSYNLIPEIQKSVKSYITTQYRFNYHGVAIKDVSITFKVFTHIDLQKTDEGILRNDFITNRIKEIFHEAKNFGIGRLRVKLEEDMQPINEKYIVSRLIFSTSDFI